jgi:hypothetical protein
MRSRGQARHVRRSDPTRRALRPIPPGTPEKAHRCKLLTGKHMSARIRGPGVSLLGEGSRSLVVGRSSRMTERLARARGCFYRASGGLSPETECFSRAAGHLRPAPGPRPRASGGSRRPAWGGRRPPITSWQIRSRCQVGVSDRQRRCRFRNARATDVTRCGHTSLNRRRLRGV